MFIIRSLVLTCALGVACATTGAAAPIRIGAGTHAFVRDLGPAPAWVSVRIAVVLRYHHDAELERLIEAQADPSSPIYHHFLSAAQFARYFAPAPAEYARVVATLRRGGFRITHAFPNRTVVDAAAPAPVAARFFGTDIHRVISPEAGVTYENVRPGLVPPAIGDLVVTVVGLDAATRLRPTFAFAPPLARRARPHHFGAPGKRIFGPDGGYGPRVFVNAYDLPAQNGDTGMGRASGVATDNDFLDSDLAAYLSYFGVARTGPATTRVLVDGGPPSGLGDDSVETTLDVETIVSIAPGTALYVYEAPYDEPTNANFIDIYNTVVSDDAVDTLNSSYIYCETAMEQQFPGYPQAVDHVERQGGAEGITFHAGSGDSGPHSPGCYSSAYSVGVSSSTTHDVAIGGTTLDVDDRGRETSEVAWSDTGGGVSVIFGLPSYQSKVSGAIQTGRNVPDLAFDADPDTGESFYYDGEWDGPIGGTSLAGPIFGAALTEVDQLENSRAGYFDVTLYKKWLEKGYGNEKKPYFRDITQGSIGPWGATPGFDQVSGIGSMQADNFARLLGR